MANTNELAVGSQLPLSILQYIKGRMRQGPNFGPAMRSFSQNYAHPSLAMSPQGGWLDPSQAQSANAQNYLGERSDIATNDMTEKFKLAQLMSKGGGIFSQMRNTIPFLNAQNISGGGGIFGGLGF